MDDLFCLEKYYMDCINNEGSAIIGYSAVLSWKSVRINFSNLIVKHSGQKATNIKSFTKTYEPEFKEDLLLWNNKKLNISGIWKSLKDPISDNLISKENGSILWECCQPLSIAEINYKDDFNISGLGYTEKIKMTLKPWELGISELRWGRFLSDDVYIIWIAWIGETTKSNVYMNGKKYEANIITENLIAFENISLKILNNTALRNGIIFNTLLKNIPFVSQIFPKSILNLNETKFIAEGELEINGELKKGWIIHEVVKW